MFGCLLSGLYVFKNMTCVFRKTNEHKKKKKTFDVKKSDGQDETPAPVPEFIFWLFAIGNGRFI